MSYELTINRVGTLVGSPRKSNASGLSKSDDIADLFHRHAELLLQSDFFRKAEAELLELAHAKDQKAARVTDPGFDDDDNHIDILVDEEKPNLVPDDDSSKPLIALFPSRRLSCKIEGTRWIIRTRATVTSCAFQAAAGQTKLWWTFEGIPQDSDPKKRPTETDIFHLLDLTNDMEKKAMPLLHKAYKHAYKKATNVPLEDFEMDEKRIRINMVDSDDRAVAALLDALELDRQKPSALRHSASKALSPAREGLKQFDRVVRKLSHSRSFPQDDAISISNDVPGMKGILFSRRDGAFGTLIVGFARRLGPRTGFRMLSNDLQRDARSEPRLRAISAARPLSAKLADLEAESLNARPPVDSKVGKPPQP
jgi:hypothetical protein